MRGRVQEQWSVSFLESPVRAHLTLEIRSLFLREQFRHVKAVLPPEVGDLDWVIVLLENQPFLGSFGQFCNFEGTGQ